MVAHDLADGGKEAQHVGQKLDIALLHGAFLRRRGGAAGHAVRNHGIVRALEVGRAVAVVEGHDLLQHEVGLLDHILVDNGLEAQLVLHVGHGGEQVALAVGAHGGTEAGVDDLRAGLGGRTGRRHEEAVGGVAVEVQDQIGPALLEGGDQLGDEGGRAHAGHVLQAEDDQARGVLLRTARYLAHHVQRGGSDIEVVFDIEALGHGDGKGGFEDHVVTREGDFGQRAHIAHIVEEVEAADDLVIVADHFAGDVHHVAGLGRVAEHVGGAHEELLQRFGGEAVPGLRLGKGIGHVGHHGHMEVCAAAVLHGEEVAGVQIRADEGVFGKAEAVAGIGLRHVAGGGVREVNSLGIAQEFEQFGAAMGVGAGRIAVGTGDVREHRIEFRQARGIHSAVLAEVHVGVVALGGNFGHKAAQAFAFGGEVFVVEELGSVSHEIGVEVGLAEFLVLKDVAVEGQGRLDAGDGVFLQRAVHDAEDAFPAAAEGDEQGAGGIVVGGEVVACAEVGVQTNAGAAGGDVAINAAAVGGEAVLRVFAVDAHLHGPVLRLGVLFVEGQFRTEGDGDLRFHKVDAVAGFGDAVFHLQAGVHFDHVGRAVAGDEEFHRGKGVVVHGLDQLAGVFLKLFAQFGGHAGPGRGGDLHQLLMVALNGAVAFVEGEDVAVLIGDDLNLDVAHVLKVAFHKEAGVAERSFGQRGGLHKGVFEFLHGADNENAAATAAAFGLEHDGKADLLDDGAGAFDVHSAFGTGNNRHAETHGKVAGLHLVAEQVHGLAGGADEIDAGFFALAGEAVVFRGEAPAGMDAHDAAGLGLADDKVEVEVGAGGGAEKHELLSGGGRRGGLVHVGGGHHGHGTETLTNGAADTARRDAAVGYEYGFASELGLYLFHGLSRHRLFSAERGLALPWEQGTSEIAFHSVF